MFDMRLSILTSCVRAQLARGSIVNSIDSFFAIIFRCILSHAYFRHHQMVVLLRLAGGCQKQIANLHSMLHGRRKRKVKKRDCKLSEQDLIIYANVKYLMALADDVK